MSDDPLGLDPMTYSLMSKCHPRQQCRPPGDAKRGRGWNTATVRAAGGAMPGKVQDRARGGPDTAGADMTKQSKRWKSGLKTVRNPSRTARSSPPVESLSAHKTGSTGPFALTARTGQYRWNLRA